MMIRIAVASGKGGTGKTLVSTNLWRSLVCENEDAVLIDCDAEAPDAGVFFKKELRYSFNVTQSVPVINTDSCVFCGKCHEYCKYNAIFFLPHVKMIRVIEELCHGCGACSFACGYGAITEKTVSLGKVSEFLVDGAHVLTEARMKAGVMSPVPVIKAALYYIAESDGIAILDSPPGTSCPFIQTVAESDYVILVTEPTPFGLSDLKQSVEILNQLRKPFGVIINRAGTGDRKVYSWLEQTGVDLLMEIPFDREIARIYSEGHLLVKEKINYNTQFIGLIQKINHITKNFKK